MLAVAAKGWVAAFAIASVAASVIAAACSDYREEAFANDAATSDASGSIDVVTNDGAADAGLGEAYARAVLGDGPVAYWRLDEASGPGAVDVTGNGAGTFAGECGFGAEGAFDGSSGIFLDGGSCAVLLGTPVDVSGTNSYSIELWWHGRAPQSTVNEYLVSLTQDYDGGGLDGVNLFAHYGAGLFVNRIVGDVERRVSTALPTAGYFHHIVATYDGTTTRLYVNATPVAAIEDTRGAYAKSPPAAIGFGPRASLAIAVFDEVALYDRALTGPQILAHYRAARP